MRKGRLLLAIILLAGLLLWACGGDAKAPGESPGAGQGLGLGENSGFGENSGSGEYSGAGQNSGSGQGLGTLQGAENGDASAASFEGGGLRLLSNRYGGSACSTESGYYYLASEITGLQGGGYGNRLMYMDFAAGREIFLCSTAGCGHDTLDCPAVFSYGEFSAYTTILFVSGDSLYILSREYDSDGSVSQGGFFAEGDDSPVESRPAVLYRANLDGTGRQKIYTFDADLTLEDTVVGNGEGIYLVTKRLSVEKEGVEAYTTSSERKLVFLDLGTGSLREVCSMDFGDHISWSITGCCQNGLLLSGDDFGRELSREEIWDDDAYKELYLNSEEAYAVLSLDDGKLREIIRQPNNRENSAALLGDILYISSKGTEEIEAVNIATGERRTLCTLSQNLIMGALGGRLCCRDWNLSEDPIWYFVDAKSGETTHSPLVIGCNGWPLEFRAETAAEVLFIYDYDVTDHGDGSYEIHRYKYALISKEDLFAGKEEFREIDMTGRGH